jgi:hypothetical protein
MWSFLPIIDYYYYCGYFGLGIACGHSFHFDLTIDYYKNTGTVSKYMDSLMYLGTPISNYFTMDSWTVTLSDQLLTYYSLYSSVLMPKEENMFSNCYYC